MTGAQIYEMGFAVPAYDIAAATRTWRYRDERYVLPFGRVWPVEVPGVPVPVAPVEVVRRAARG